MKKTSLIINIVLALAVVALYVLHFTGKSTSTCTSDTKDMESVAKGEQAIAWVNMDSVLANYDMYFDIQQELESKGRKMESDLNTKTRSFEREMIDFQDKVQKGLVTRSTAQQMQQDLAVKEQELYLYRDDLRMRFAEEEQVMLRRIQHSINEYAEKFNKEKGYEIILSGAFGGALLYGHPSIDVTSEVISGLNKEYQSTLKKK